MELDLSILNQKGSPAIYQDLFALRPTAGFTGRLFVSTDTDELYRDNGTTWDLIGGGGGGAVGDGISILGAGTVGSPFNTGLDAVLATGQALTTDRSFKFNGFNVDFTDCDRVRYQLDSTGSTVFEINDTLNKVEIGYSQFKGTFTTSNFTIFNSLKGLTFDTSYFQLFDLNISTWFGFQIDLTGGAKFGNDFNSYIGTGGKIIQTFFDSANIQKGIYLDANNDTYVIGDKINFGSRIDLTNKIFEVFDLNGSLGIGIDIPNEFYYFGDWQGIYHSNAYIWIDGSVKTFNIETNAVHFTSSAIITGSAGGNSGQHLKVTVNGTNYVIKLENP
jgi:hypothetical protein